MGEERAGQTEKAAAMRTPSPSCTKQITGRRLLHTTGGHETLTLEGRGGEQAAPEEGDIRDGMTHSRCRMGCTNNYPPVQKKKKRNSRVQRVLTMCA